MNGQEKLQPIYKIPVTKVGTQWGLVVEEASQKWTLGTSF